MLLETIDIKRIAVEMASIIFAVLIALWLENWWSAIELQQRSEQMLLRIGAEVSNNHTELKIAMSENTKNVEAITKALDKDTFIFADIATFLRISAGSTSDSAWSSAQMTETLGVMPIDTVTELANLYDTQEYYANYARFFVEQYTDLTMEAQNVSSGKIAAKKFLQHLQILNTLAIQLVASYEAFLDHQEGSKNITTAREGG